MATSTRKKIVAGAKGIVALDQASKTIGGIWDHWVNTLGHTEAAAEKKLKAVIKKLHASETKKKKKVSSLKKKIVSKVTKKKTKSKK